MVNSYSSAHEAAFQRYQKALSGWENESDVLPRKSLTDIPEMTNTELVNLRIRVIALENLIVTVLAEGTDRQLAVAREMAAYISPRAGFTQHPLTIKAADQMNAMADRAEHFRRVSSS